MTLQTAIVDRGEECENGIDRAFMSGVLILEIGSLPVQLLVLMPQTRYHSGDLRLLLLDCGQLWLNTSLARNLPALHFIESSSASATQYR